MGLEDRSIPYIYPSSRQVVYIIALTFYIVTLYIPMVYNTEHNLDYKKVYTVSIWYTMT